jgi:hypothetical protein
VDYFLQTKDGQQAGPYGVSQLRAFWADGRVTRTTPYCTPGMTAWRPLSDLENLLSATQPPLTPQVPVTVSPPASKPKRKGLGCGSGFLILIVLFGAFIRILSLLPPDKEDASKPKVETAWGKGYDSGVKLGYACALMDYNGGKLKESSEQLDANARGLSEGDTDAQHRAGFISGIKQGYETGWEQGGH